MLIPMVPLTTPGDAGKVDFGGPGCRFFRVFGDFCPPLPTNFAPKIDPNPSFRFLTLLCMANRVVQPRIPGHPGKVDFGCPELFENFEKIEKIEKLKTPGHPKSTFPVSPGIRSSFFRLADFQTLGISVSLQKTHFYAILEFLTQG